MEKLSIFEKIARGEMPCHRVYEDDKTLAFLDIHPQSRLGHVLVIPKRAMGDKIYKERDEAYDALMRTVKKLAAHMDSVLGVRIMYFAAGEQVPWPHVHLLPYDPEWHPRRTFQLSDDEMREIVEKLRLD